jgi:hypothetical protein
MLLAELDQISSPLHFEVPPAEGNSKTISNLKKENKTIIPHQPQSQTKRAIDGRTCLA